MLNRYDPSAPEVILKFLSSALAPGIVCACGQQITTQVMNYLKQIEDLY